MDMIIGMSEVINALRSIASTTSYEKKGSLKEHDYFAAFS